MEEMKPVAKASIVEIVESEYGGLKSKRLREMILLLLRI